MSVKKYGWAIQENLLAQTNQSVISRTSEKTKIFIITSKCLNFFNNTATASWVAHVIRDFLTCYSWSYYSSKVNCFQQTPPTEVAAGDILQKSCSLKFLKVHRKIPVSESFIKRNFIKKKTLAQVFSCEFCEIYKDAFFTKHLWMTASSSSKKR